MSRDKVEFNWDEEKKGGISDLLKKIVATGMSSPFLSEEQLKTYLSGLNLPKEVVVQVIRGAQKSKDEIVNKVGFEFSKLIQKIDIVKEFKTMLSEHKISVKADIEFVPKSKSDESNQEIQ